VRLPRVSAVAGLAFALWGLAVGLARLHDNSFLTHLATGRLLLAHGVPTTDPYTFTAHGRPWVVESWLASLVYGLVDRAAGGHGLQLLHAALAATLAALGWVLTRPAHQLPGRLAVAAFLLAVGSGYWSPRPLLLGLVLLAVLVVMVETGRGSPWWAAPLMWVWVDVHASWPLGLVYLALRWAGRRVQRRPPGRLPALTAAAAVGTAAAAVNPVGLRLLLYPLTVLEHHRAFANVAEWQPPSFADPANAVLLAGLALAVVALVARRGTVEDTLVAAVFGAGALLAARNVPVAALVLTPVLSRCLAGLGTLDGARRGVLPAVAVGALAAVGAVAVAGALGQPAYDLSAYPVGEVSWMAGHHLVPGRVAAPDYVGNYLELRYGTRASAFFDDRVDVFPLSTVRDYDTLLLGRPGWEGVLARHRVDAVLWPRAQRLARLLGSDHRWSVRLADRDWVVAVRTSPRP